MEDATPEQIDKAFKLCDMLGLADVTIAFAILQELNWSVEVLSPSFRKLSRWCKMLVRMPQRNPAKSQSFP